MCENFILQVQPVSHLAIPLLQLLLSQTSPSPTILSEILSCISAVFCVVLVAPDALSVILTRMFQPLSVSPPTVDNKEIRPVDVTNIMVIDTIVIFS